MAIDTFISKVEKDTAKLERDLYDEIMAIIAGLIFEGGKVKWSAQNIALVGKVDLAFREFDKVQTPFMNNIKKELAGLEKFYIDYLDSIGVKSKSLKAFKTLIGRMDAYLDSVALLEPIKQEVKQYLLGAISGGRSMGSIRSGMRDILGLKERTGALNRYYRNFLYDSIMQFDRIVSNKLAEQNDLKYFVYDGGLISTSRDFCIKRNGLVFNKNNISDWAFDPTLPPTPGYVPITDFGSYGCRHFPRWITDEQAKEINEKEASNK